MARSKLMSEAEAVRRFVDDGDVIYAGYTTIAFGLCHEIIRQRKQHLEIVGGSVGGQGSVLFLSGCADRTRTGYIGGALRPGAIQGQMAEGTLRYEDYSNQAIALMLMAGALGIPFIPTRSFLGSDYLRPEYQEHPGGFLGQKKWAVMESPFDGQPVVLLPALRPDVIVLQAQRADEDGNVQMWGHLGDARWAFWAGRKVIVSVEEVAPAETIRSDPSRTVVPGFRVSAVVHMPYGAHPSSLTGYYDSDYAFQARVMAGVGQNRATYEAFAAEWIEGVPDRAGYIRHYRDLFGDTALEAIAARRGVTPKAEVRYTHAAELRFGA